jgi:hypothetical protein
LSSPPSTPSSRAKAPPSHHPHPSHRPANRHRSRPTRQATRETCAAAAEHVLDGLTNRRERERQFAPTSIV